MKKFSVLCLLIIVIATAYSQTYKISFAGKGASTTVDSVQVQNLTQCRNISLKGNDTLVLYGNVGINEISNTTDNSLRIYPNPTTGYCLVDFEATEQGETTIGLYDITGKRIVLVQEFLLKGQHTYKLSGIGSGIYVLKVESAKYTYTAKIISSNLTSGIAENRTQITQINMMNTDNNKNKDSINVSHLENVKHLLKGNKSLIDLPYITGDTLKLKGFSSGIYSTVNILVPTKSQTDTFNFIACTDGDNNNYAVVQIGTQIWMEENLKTTKYNDGTAIPNVTDSTAWANSSTPGYCWYNDSAVKYKNTYGALYNWYAVGTGKLCPTGWHVPSDSEWTVLVTYLGGWFVERSKMKDICSTYWDSPNTGATNSSGFTALPGGYRSDYGGSFYGLGYYGYWWSATDYNAPGAWDCSLSYDFPGATLQGGDGKTFGFSVRCVKNN